jgi:hypothetical protein
VIGRHPHVPGAVVEPLDFLDAVVPDAQYAAQTVPGPNAVADLHALNGARAAFSPDQRAFCNAQVAAGSKTFDVFRGVGAEEFGL